MSDFHFVICSKDENFMMNREVFSTFDNVRVDYVSNNRTPITKLYNKFLDDATDTSDFIIFVHADVKLDVNHLIGHIEECKSRYDVMGLCGCEKISVSQSPFNWFTSSRSFPEYRWGCVTHGEDNLGISFFSRHRKERDHDVACIDGLCMILSRFAIENGLRFDENLTFDCYDSQLSLSTILEKHMRLGVIVEESLQHYSVGKSILTEKFLRNEYFLRKRFDFEIPDSVQKAHQTQNNKPMQSDV